MSNSENLPKWFKPVAIIALIWNLLGVVAYLGDAFITDEALSLLPEEQRSFIENRPAWATAAFATAVWAGFIGSLLLLLRRSLSYVILIISFVGVLIQMSYNFFIADAMDVYGPGGAVMPIMVLIFGVVLILIAKKGNSAGWFK